MKEKITVYLIEDYKLTRIGLKSVLGRMENIICTGDCPNINQGLKEIVKQKPDILLIDMDIKDSDILSAIRKITNLMPEIKIIVLTSLNKSFETVLALSAGAMGYCMKDAPDEILEKAIKTVYSGACFLDGSIWGLILKYFPPVDDSMNPYKLSQIDKKYMLSKRELEVLKYVVNGESNIEISEKMFVSVYTTKAYIASIFKKLSVNDRVQAAVKAIREQLV